MALLLVSTEVAAAPAGAASLPPTSGPAGLAVRSSHSGTHPSSVLSEVYREHFDFVWRNVRRLGAREEWADDATHEVFLVVARRLGEFRHECDLKTWLFAIALRVVARMSRDRARHQRKLERHASEPLSRPEPESRVISERTLRQLLGCLSEPKRVVFILSELEGMTSAEIARSLGVPMGTVDTRLRSARLQLRALLTEDLQRTGGSAP
jgi:RNA polymerase sigma-70 factor (ECF subfamily)